MDDSTKKAVVVVVGIALFLPFVLWRSLRARMEGLNDADWEKLISEERLAEAPTWFQPPQVIVVHAEPNGPHLRLATLRFRQRRDYLDTVERRDPNFNFPPLYRRALAMRANAYRNESIEDVDGGVADLVQAVYLLHAGKVPADVRARARRFVCQATAIIADSAAEEAGMHDGDDFLDVDGRSVVEATEACAETVARLKAPAGTHIRLGMLRDGDRVELELVKRGDINGFAYQRVPILDE